MARIPDPIDVHVGERIRLRRRTLGLSQQHLADALGLTFQQVQKYERGTNRVSASKLYAAAQALRAPISYFFEGFSHSASNGPCNAVEQMAVAFLSSVEGLELAQRFPRIARASLRRRLLELVRAAAEEEPTSCG